MICFFANREYVWGVNYWRPHLVLVQLSLIRVFMAVFEPSKLLKTRIVVSWRLEQSRV